MPTPQPTPTPYPRLAIPPGTLRCHTAQLEVALVGGAAAAGTVLEDFEMRNRSGTGCWVYGYVGFQVLDSTGKPLRQTVSRATDLFFGRSAPPTAIFLPSGTAGLGLNQGLGHAFFNVATDDVLCTSDYYDSIARLEIWPPDEFTALIIPAGNPAGVHFVTCGSMTINPLQVQQGPSYSS